MTAADDGASPDADGASLDGLARAAADWGRLEGLLDPAERALLAAHLTAFRAAAPGTAHRAAAAGAALLLLDGGAAAGGSRLAGGAPGPVPAGYTAQDLAVLVLDGHRMVGPVLGAVRERLLAAPALAAPPQDGPDPYDARLVRLRGAGGTVLLPAFQFRSPPRPWPVVLAVNEALDAASDPWGAADWWLSPNAWLAAAPASLLGSAREAELPLVAFHLTNPTHDS